jgi:hypothetical protein
MLSRDTRSLTVSLSVHLLLLSANACAVLKSPQVSADGEVKLYEACMAAGITLLSIAHRPTLKRFHQLVVHIDGTVSTTGKGWWTEVRNIQHAQLA